MADFDENELNIADGSVDAVDEAIARAKRNGAEQNEAAFLGEEYNQFFAPEDGTFSIDQIPDREADELSEEELARLADMQLDDLLDDVIGSASYLEGILGNDTIASVDDITSVGNSIEDMINQENAMREAMEMDDEEIPEPVSSEPQSAIDMLQGMAAEDISEQDDAEQAALEAERIALEAAKAATEAAERARMAKEAALKAKAAVNSVQEPEQQNVEEIPAASEIPELEMPAGLEGITDLEELADLPEMQIAGLGELNFGEGISDAEISGVTPVELDGLADLGDIALDESIELGSIDSLFGTGAAVAMSEAEIAAGENLAKADNTKAEDEKAGKGKKDKKGKKGKKATEIGPDGLPKKTLGQKILSIFFEKDEAPEVEDEKKAAKAVTKDSGDENAELLKERYGSDIEGDPLGELGEAPEKYGFFTKLKMIFKKNKAEELLEEEAEAQEAEEKAKKKAEKKAAAEAKKNEPKEKPVKEKKPKAPKAPKPKKPKPAPKPGDILKIKPKSIIMLILFVSGAVILTHLANSNVYYKNATKKANEFFLRGDYALAYAEISGIELEEEDKGLMEQIKTVMYVEKQYESYLNYNKLGMRVEALDSLIKGVLRYQLHSKEAEVLGVMAQYDAIAEKILEALRTDYSISKEKAYAYAQLLDENFVQYYNTIQTYGGTAK